MSIDLIFEFQSTRDLHKSLPLLSERESFLSFIQTRGASKYRLRTCAAMLLHVIRLMRLDSMRVVSISEIKEASLTWSLEAKTNRNHSRKTPKFFLYLATRWHKFHDTLAGHGSHITGNDLVIEHFATYMKTILGLSPVTTHSQSRRVKPFLMWAAGRQQTLETIVLTDVDAYLQSKLEGGYLPRSIFSLCVALRSFFFFVETQGFRGATIAHGICCPRIPRRNATPMGPQWSDVRRMLDFEGEQSARSLRDAAIISLCAIYGLRSIEVVRMKLSDLDWHNEILTVRRAKSGRVQHFPIQLEVGGKIIRYLRGSRPKCECRNLFVSLAVPYRTMHSTSVWEVVSRRMTVLGISSINRGGHALRHACATELLHKGSSLPDIAEFLGHRDLKSVSVYAKHDSEAMKEVAAFDLEGLI